MSNAVSKMRFNTETHVIVLQDHVTEGCMRMHDRMHSVSLQLLQLQDTYMQRCAIQAQACDISFSTTKVIVLCLDIKAVHRVALPTMAEQGCDHRRVQCHVDHHSMLRHLA
jgi:hypothetical protein